MLGRACQCGATQHLTECDDPRRCDQRPSCAHDPLARRRLQRPNCMGPTQAKAVPSKSVRICSNSSGVATPCSISARIPGTRMRDSTSAREDEGLLCRARLHLRLQCVQHPTAPLRPVPVAPASPKWSSGDHLGWLCRALPRPGREGCRRAPSLDHPGSSEAVQKHVAGSATCPDCLPLSRAMVQCELAQ